MKSQIIGDKQSLKSEPRNVLPDNHKSPNAQNIGTAIKLSTSPGPKYGAGTQSGTFQIIGDKSPLKDTPRLGYESANTPMSERAVESKKNF